MLSLVQSSQFSVAALRDTAEALAVMVTVSRSAEWAVPEILRETALIAGLLWIQSARVKVLALILRPDQVAELLAIDDPIRVKNYSDVEAYGINPVHVGIGRGSRKLYDFDDVLRIAVAEQLFRFGFSAHAIGAALGKIKESELDPENGHFLLVQTRKLTTSTDFGWKVIPRDEEHEWRKANPAESKFVLDLTATVVPVWERAGGGNE